MKSATELQKLERAISKSNAPSKTKPVEERLFQDTGAKGFVDRPRLPQADYYDDMEDCKSGEAE